MTTDRPTTPDIPLCGCAQPGSADPSFCYCGVEDLLRIIRRRYSLAVMNAIHRRGDARYQDIAASIPQASSSTLAETLHALERARLINRMLTPEPAPYPVYTLAPAGAKLLSRLRRLLDEVQASEG
jgi:DNA-binding HxlR family transcriptional regulator